MENNIKESRDYDSFSLMDNNRVINKKHVNKIKNAFEESGNFTKVQPILVNEKLEIIDGQHRFQASKELNQPIFYTIVPGLGVKEARQMNILQRGWTIDDYAASYASGGDPNYQRFLQLKDDFGFTNSITLIYCARNGAVGRRGIFPEFRSGDFVLDDLMYDITHERLGQLADVAELTSVAYDRSFARAFLVISMHENYDHKRMLNKVRLYGGVLRKLPRVDDNVRQLEDVYNFRQTEENRVRFF